MRSEIVIYSGRLDNPGPTHENWNTPAAFPVGVFLGTVRRDTGVGTAIVMRSFVRRIDNDSVFSDTQLVKLFQHHADMLIVSYHYIVVVTLPALALVALGAVGPEVHSGGVVPQEERAVVLMSAVEEIKSLCGNLVIDGFHALSRERTGILNRLASLAIRPAMQYASRSETFFEIRILRIVRILGLFFGVQMVEIAEELIEAVHGRQEFVLVAEMVLAELPCSVAEGLQQFGDGRILRAKTQVRSRHADLGQTGANRVLTGDERGAAGRATLLTIIVSKGCSFMPDAVDIRRPITHLAAIVVADIPPANIVTPQYEDIRLPR